MALLIMKDFNKLVIKFARFLQSLLVIAIGLLGVLLIILLFRDLIPLFQALISPSIKESNAAIMDEIIVFFLFFEFTAMIIAALRHHGHTSINFLMGLGHGFNPWPNYCSRRCFGNHCHISFNFIVDYRYGDFQ